MIITEYVILADFGEITCFICESETRRDEWYEKLKHSATLYKGEMIDNNISVTCNSDCANCCPVEMLNRKGISEFKKIIGDPNKSG